LIGPSEKKFNQALNIPKIDILYKGNNAKFEHILCWVFSGVVFCLNFTPFFFLLLFPCQACFFFYLFIYLLILCGLLIP